MRLAALLLAIALPVAADARHPHAPRPPAATVILDGVATPVRWTDGDTFRIEGGTYRGILARLVGYNTLESYGPVHRWGGWTREELLALANAAAPVASSRAWTCAGGGGADRYRRLLVRCPDLARELVGRGLAMVFAVDAPADPGLVALQREAQRAGGGMWAKGVPPHLPTGVHSVAENDGGPTYDRVVDTATGEAQRWPHRRAYRVCEEVCAGEGAGRACMLYVPHRRTYKNRPWCLR